MPKYYVHIHTLWSETSSKILIPETTKKKSRRIRIDPTISFSIMTNESKNYKYKRYMRKNIFMLNNLSLSLSLSLYIYIYIELFTVNKIYTFRNFLIKLDIFFGLCCFCLFFKGFLIFNCSYFSSLVFSAISIFFHQKENTSFIQTW